MAEKLIIPDAADAKTVFLVVVVAGHTGVTAAEVTVPCVRSIVLRSRPPEPVDSNIVEASIDAAIAARQRCEPAAVRSTFVGA